MKTFTVTIEETISQDFKIDAESGVEAIAIAEQKYHDGEFVLEPGELVTKQMAITSPDSEATLWAEF